MIFRVETPYEDRVLRSVATNFYEACQLAQDLYLHNDYRIVGVAANQRRHERGVSHAQAFQSMHLAMLIGHGHFIAAHFASADRMIQRLAGCTDPRIKLVIIVDIDILGRLQLLAPIGVKGFLQENDLI